MIIKTWGELKKQAELEGLADDAPILMSVYNEQGQETEADLIPASVMVLCPIEGAVKRDDCHDDTGFLIIQKLEN